MNKKNTRKIIKANTVLKAEERAETTGFMNLQRNYKANMLTLHHWGAEMMEMRKQIKSGKIEMQWYGMTMPKEILGCEHDIKQHNYFDIVVETERIKNSLIEHYGMTKEQLDVLVSSNSYTKELPIKNNKGEKLCDEPNPIAQ